jgi:hypothetical protein
VSKARVSRVSSVKLRGEQAESGECDKQNSEARILIIVIKMSRNCIVSRVRRVRRRAE